jgi:hypothetical protein
MYPTTLSGVGTTEQVGDFVFLFTPQAVFISGDVLDNGADLNLNKTGTYQRVGTPLGFQRDKYRRSPQWLWARRHLRLFAVVGRPRH